MNYKLERSNEEIVSVGGVALVSQALKRIAFDAFFACKKTGDALKTMTALLCQGRADFNDVELFRGDEFFRETLELGRVPSEATLRQRLDRCGGDEREGLRAAIRATLSHVRLTPVKADSGEYVPVDVDPAPFDNSGTKKEGVSRTYMGFDGYSPAFAYVGAEGFLLDCELREGSAHTQRGAPAFLRRCARALRGLVKAGKALFRADAGYDAYENILALDEAGCKYIVKRNLRSEPLEPWIEKAKAEGAEERPRPGKRIWTGAAEDDGPPANGRGRAVPCRVAYRVVERTTDAKGQGYLVPKVEVHLWWTNLPDPAAKVFKLYCGHATYEQCHSEFKTDIGVERLPSGKFSTNETVLLAGGVAFNVLRTLGQEVLDEPDLMPVKADVQRRRAASVIRDLVFVAVKRVRHAGRVVIRFGRRCPWFEAFRAVYEKLTPDSRSGPSPSRPELAAT